MRNRFERKLVSVLVALAMLLSLLPMSAFAAGDNGADDAVAPMVSPFTLTITVNINPMIQGKDVTTDNWIEFKLDGIYFSPTIVESVFMFKELPIGIGQEVIKEDDSTVRVTLNGKVPTVDTSGNFVETTTTRMFPQAAEVFSLVLPTFAELAGAGFNEEVSADELELATTIVNEEALTFAIVEAPPADSETGIVVVGHGLDTLRIGQTLTTTGNEAYFEYRLTGDYFNSNASGAVGFHAIGTLPSGLTQTTVIQNAPNNTIVRVRITGTVGTTNNSSEIVTLADGMSLPSTIEGAYTVSGKEYTISADYNKELGLLETGTFTKAETTATGSPTASAITYGETLNSSTITGVPIGVTGFIDNLAGEWSWDASVDLNATPNAGAHEYGVIFKPTQSEYYADYEYTVTVIVNKATLTLPPGTIPTATSVYAGQTLNSSTIAPTTLLGISDTPIAGTWSWVAPSTLVNTAGSYAAVFTPTNATDKLNYIPYETNINVVLNSGTYSPSSPSSSGSSGSSGIASYVVAFETNGGSAIKSVTIAHGLKVTKPADPTKRGADFLGWYTDKEFTTLYDFNKPVTGNITLYAKWSGDGEADGETGDGTDGPYADWNNPFIDVSPDDWFFEDVGYAYESGLLIGTTDTTFEPNTPLTRAMLVTVLHRYDGEPEVSTDAAAEFTDIDTDEYYYGPLLWAVENELVFGDGEGNFRPDDPIRRQEFAAILMRYSAYTGVNMPAPLSFAMFADGDEVEEYASNAIQMLHALDIMRGVGGNRIDPNGFATRAQVAALIHRYDTHVIALGMEAEG